MRIKRNEKRDADVLKKQFQMVMDQLVPLARNGNVSGAMFDAACRSMYGTSIRQSIRTRFASSKGKNDGFNQLKTELGYTSLRTFSKQEIIDRYIELYKKTGKQPTETDITRSGISMNPVYRHFGNHMTAVDAMYQAMGIDQQATYPLNVNVNRGEKIGEDLSSLPIGLKEGPVNEQGVVFVFAKVHHQIGFPVVEKPQQEFPDCRATCIRGTYHSRVNIEFKYLSSMAFKKGRGIEAYLNKKINYLICWENNSPGNTRKLARVGIEIISLREELIKLFRAPDLKINSAT